MRRDDAGTVTAELAVALVGVLVVLGGLGSAVSVGVAQVRVTDAAAAGARLAARGEDGAAVRAAAVHLGGAGSAVTVGSAGDLTAVDVSRRVPVLVPGGPSVVVRSRAVAVTEDSPARSP